MKRSLILLYWLLLLVPTLWVGALTLDLLQHEEERVALAEHQAARGRVGSLADNLAAAVQDVEDGLILALTDLGPRPDISTLVQLERTHPLVRNVFLVDPSGAVRLPDNDTPLTREEQGFLDRYQALLSGRTAWDRSPQEDQFAVEANRFREAAQVDRKINARANLKLLAQYGQAADIQMEAVAGGGIQASDWIPWFWEDGLYLLGWVRTADGTVYGAEMETASLLASLIPYLRPPEIPGESLALLDGSGHVFHQAGAFEVDPDAEVYATAPVGTFLPHWRVNLYRNGAATWGKRTAVLSSLLVALLVVAVLCGGSLLLWQAHRNLRDAREKTSFVANVSHELKTPLTTIRMYADLLSEDRVRDEGRRRDYLRVITDESRRLTRLVNNVLDFGRLEQHRKQYHREVVEVGAVVRDTLETQRMRLEQEDFELVMHLPDQEVPAVTDRDALEQSLLNLVDNAVKYAEDGRRIEINLQGEADAVRVTVRDFGPGIPRAQRELIFRKFHRIDSSLTSRTQGSGLGLTIARQLMRDLGGDLTCRPADGGGTRFDITLPVPASHEGNAS